MKKIYFHFMRACNRHSLRIEKIRLEREKMNRWEFDRLTESIMSDMWQSWCLFCRDVLMKSCRGAVSLDDSFIEERTSHAISDYNSWKRIGYEASKNKHPDKIINSGHNNFFMRFEPTWGDLDCIIRIIQTLHPSNETHLLSAFGSGQVLKHLQCARNACAHKNVELIYSLNNEMRPYYKFRKLKSPSDLSWCHKRNESVFAIIDWLYEMRKIAKEATRSR
ncbi:hypothetical protein [Brenneria tiliae]|uniref:Abi-like protein n=1 Tax=Brenneria tiliae TaxID=2914984 RepID=A0ABT0MWQ9_9GAMM|nr:hypothetical protein [Brenneria tiliae]MCL2894279.1 hypothetical protein [Brenneria tiliae]